VSLGDPAFGHTFEAMRAAVVAYWVVDRRNKWECLRCRRRWCETEHKRGVRDPHAPDCLLGLNPRKAATSSQRP
jgi:hypothetical protein